jgi:hypothetical protein
MVPLLHKMKDIRRSTGQERRGVVQQAPPHSSRLTEIANIVTTNKLAK